MICQTCGADSAAPGLRYCKQCGANLSLAGESQPPSRFPTAVTIVFLLVVGFITMIGVGLPLAASSDMTHAGFGPEFALRIIAFSTAAVVLIDAMLIWLLLKLIKIYHPPPLTQVARPQPSREVAPRQLAVPFSEVGSVTEHTTRNFAQPEEVLRGRVSDRDTAEQ